MAPTLRPYQETAVAEIREKFAAGNRRVLCVMPTGAGKTVLLSHIAHRYDQAGKRVAILVHRDRLLRQTSTALDTFNIRHGFIAAGRSGSAAAVQICSVKTLANRIKTEKFLAWFKPELIIPDEAHHVVAGNSWGRVLEAFPASKVMGVTATPIRLDGRGLAANFDQLVIGPSTKQLTEWGYLAPAEVYAPPTGLDLSKVHTKMGDYAKGEIEKLMDRPTIHGSALEHYLKLAAGLPAIAFCVSIKHAEHCAAEFAAAGVRAAVVHSELDTTECLRRLDGLGTGEYQVVFSVDLVSEGVDIPAVAAAILLRPTQSLVVYLQQVGRALRPYPGKEYAIILDHVGNCMRHGLPADEREWELTHDKIKSKRNTAGMQIASIRTCLECYCTQSAENEVCQRCGMPFPVKSKADLKTVAGELTKVTSRPKPAPRVKADVAPELKERLLAGAKSLKQFQNVARVLGYKSGWAFHQWQQSQRRTKVSPSPAPFYDPATAEAF